MNESENFASPALLDGKFQVQLESYKSHQKCPFPCLFDARDLGAYDLIVKNSASGQQMNFPGLIIHLIREHGFLRETPPIA